MIELFTWLGILFCVSQSAMFSGLNLAFFSISKMQLEIESSHENLAAAQVLKMREDSNFLLTTILWGNVGINVLLTLLSNSVMTGIIAFLFSTFVITLFGEIGPQAYFSRNALRMASILSPILRFYQLLLYPLAKPSAKILDLWLGKESIEFFREKQIEEMIHMHIQEHSSDITHVEGKGALNFLAIDDLQVAHEGELVEPMSIIEMEFEGNQPVFPEITASIEDSFLRQIHASKKPWIIITDKNGLARQVINADEFLHSALFEFDSFTPMDFCHRPVIVSNLETTLGDAILSLQVNAEHSEDDVIDQDIILIWGKQRRIITGADILGRLLRGIAAK
ncbi:MAG: DUF21 domain-containing protein [Gammaproteobacteria bacterium]|nr:DUF21 domain-containing protein [Gammaproteobacteria bacterium]